VTMLEQRSVFAFLVVATAICVATTIEKMSIRTGAVDGTVLAFLYIEGSDGVVGLGQMGRSQMDSSGILADDDLVADSFLRHVAPLAYKADISTPEALSKLTSTILYRNYKNTGQILNRAIAGLDTAVWDLLAKADNQSVCDYAAARMEPARECRDNVKVYCTNITRQITADQTIDLIANLHTQLEVDTFKYKIAETMGNNADVTPNKTILEIPYIRKALDVKFGAGRIKLIVDANGGYSDAEHAKPAAVLLGEHHYEWFEEPVPFWNIEQTKVVKKFGVVPVAAGENEYRMDMFERIINQRVVDIVQPDFGYAGGFSNALKIADLAAKQGIVVDPHSPDKSMTEFFSLHFLGAISNPGPALEYGCVDPTDIAAKVFQRPIQIKNATVPVPREAAGWGVEILDSWLQHASTLTYP